jgi:hypothetical protein
MQSRRRLLRRRGAALDCSNTLLGGLDDRADQWSESPEYDAAERGEGLPTELTALRTAKQIEFQHDALRVRSRRTKVNATLGVRARLDDVTHCSACPAVIHDTRSEQPIEWDAHDRSPGEGHWVKITPVRFQGDRRVLIRVE